MAYFIGLMSGTSMDAVDAALVAFDGDTPDVLAYCEHPLPDTLRTELTAVREAPSRIDLDRIGRLDRRIGRLFADAVAALLQKADFPPRSVTAIGSHGQTLLHRPTPPEPFSIQLGDPNVIALRTGITTVADFRRMDIAAGGQGAPLAPAFHAARFRSTARDTVVVNIGGIANITVLPADSRASVLGFDTGPGNCLLDEWVYSKTGKAMDRDGRWAQQGQVDAGLLDMMLADPYFSAPPPKSTGREYFNLSWLQRMLARTASPPTDETVQATLVQLTARSIAAGIRAAGRAPRQALICGGGARNPVLMRALADHLPGCSVESTAAYGLEPERVEAVAFAWLAKRRLEGLNGNIPEVTGAGRAVVLGGVYTAAGHSA